MSDRIPSNPCLERIPRYVRGRSVRDLEEELNLEIVKLGSNENLLGPSPMAVKAIERAAADLNQYPSVEVHDLREKLAAKLGAGLTVDNVIVGNGSADVLRSIGQAYIFDHAEALIQLPAFQMYEMVTAMYQGTPVILPFGSNYDYDLEAIAQAITPRTRLIFLNSPHNPTGRIIPRSQLDPFIARVPSSVLVVLDEAYVEFADSPDLADSLGYVREGRNVIVTRTFSKLHGLAGLRVGYGIARPDIIDVLLRTQPPFHTGRLPLAGAMAALDDEEHTVCTREMNAEGKRYLYGSFEEMGLEYIPTQANFVLLVNLKFDVGQVDAGMTRRGIIVRPADSFGLANAIRITIGNRAANEQVITALRETLAELGAGKGGR